MRAAACARALEAQAPPRTGPLLPRLGVRGPFFSASAYPARKFRLGSSWSWRGVPEPSLTGFRRFRSTKQETGRTRFELLKNPVKGDCRTTRFLHRRAEILHAFFGLAGEPVDIAAYLDSQFAEGFDPLIQLADNLADFLILAVQHCGELIHIGQRGRDRLFVLGDKVIEPFDKRWHCSGPRAQRRTGPGRTRERLGSSARDPRPWRPV